MSVSVDTWGVDFVLLDEKDQVIGDTVGYRDRRTEGMDHKVEAVIPQEELYRRTGIQKQSYNTIYQRRRSKKSIRNSWKKQKTCLCCGLLPLFTER